MRKVKVKFLDSIAGLRDLTPEQQEQRYRQLRSDMKADGRHNDEIEKAVVQAKHADAHALRPGFAKDWAFKAGDEAIVNAEVAEKWEEQGICTIQGDKKAAA